MNAIAITSAVACVSNITAVSPSGFDYAQDIVFPASGLTGNLMRIGTFGFSIGVGPMPTRRTSQPLAVSPSMGRPSLSVTVTSTMVSWAPLRKVGCCAVVVGIRTQRKQRTQRRSTEAALCFLLWVLCSLCVLDWFLFTSRPRSARMRRARARCSTADTH